MTTYAPPPRTRFRRSVWFVPVLLTGCATAADGTRTTIVDDVQWMFASCEADTAEETRLCEAAKKHASTRLTGAATGAAVGCLAGFGTGMVATGDAGGRAALTAAGCAAGAFLGYAAGAYVDRVNTEAANEQTDLRARIAAADEDAARYRRAADDADASVRAVRADIARLNRDYAAGQVSADEFGRKIARAETTADSLRALIVESSGTIGYVERDIEQLQAAGRNTGALEQRLARLERENERLIADYQSLVDTIDGVPPTVDRPNVA